MLKIFAYLDLLLIYCLSYQVWTVSQGMTSQSKGRAVYMRLRVTSATLTTPMTGLLLESKVVALGKYPPALSQRLVKARLNARDIWM